MNKIICDVCGTDYPETVPQCPICGCSNVGNGQTSAGNTAGPEEPVRRHTKGGHFSKANVRKRTKSTQEQRFSVQTSGNTPDYDDDDSGFDEDELEGVSNKGLILIVILLLIACIAVSTYIMVTFFGDKNDEEPGGTNAGTHQTSPSATDPSDSGSTDPSGTDVTEPSSEPVVDRIPCEGLSVDMAEIILQTDAPMEIRYSVKPANTTDAVTFSCDNTAVARVDANGRVFAVGKGTATITVTCGDQKVTIPVRCLVSGTDIPTDPTDPSTPTDPVTPTTPSTGVKLELNRVDFSLFFVGDKWTVYNGTIDKTQITWTSDNEAVAKVENGTVIAVGPGSTTIRAEYQGQTAACKVYCQFKVETTEPTDPVAPTEPSEPSEPSEEVTDPSDEVTDPSDEITEPSDVVTDPTDEITEPGGEVTEPSEPVLEHKLLINGAVPAYLYQGKANSGDVTLSWRDGNPEYCRLTITNAENVVWTSNDEAVAVVEVRDAANCRVIAKSKGRALLTATVDGVEFIVAIYVS